MAERRRQVAFVNGELPADFYNGLFRAANEVVAERLRQVQRHRYSPEHDDTHHRTEWAWLIARRANELGNPFGDAVPPEHERRMLVEMAAIALAALEAFDRRGGT